MTPKQHLLNLAAHGLNGAHWYTDATRDIEQHCRDRGVDTRKFIHTLAVLSPKVDVATNVRWTVGFWFFQLEPILVRSVRTSFDRLRASDFMRSAIKGPKTGRFADALLGDTNAVVLDTHMGYALNVPAEKLRNKSVQTEAEKRIGWVAKQLGITPRDTQAAIWTRQRELAGYAYSSIDLDAAINRLRETNPF